MSALPPLVVPGIRLRGADPDGEERRALERARQPWIAGFCLFGGERDQVTRLTAALREAAGRPIFVASDMECGAGQQVEGLRRLPEAAVWGLGGGPEDAEAFGRMTAEDALSVGVDVLFAPVLDVMSEPANPIVGVRAFSWDPARVARLGAAFSRGVRRGGALPVGKHYPGHGGTDLDSHAVVPSVGDTPARLEARDLLPFHAAVADGSCSALMTAHVLYEHLDPTHVATLSPSILDRLRSGIPGGADVALFTDALLMDGVKAGIGEVEAGRRALLAGCDFLLCPDDAEAVAEGMRDVPADVQAGALRRATLFLDALAEARRHAERGNAELDAARVAEVARRAVHVAGAPRDGAGPLLVLDDDGVTSRGEALSRAAAAQGVEVSVLRTSEGMDVPAARTVVVMATVGAWKGERGLTPAAAEAIGRLRSAGARIVWCGVAPDRPEPHLPGTAPDVEEALAEALLGSRT